MRTGRVEALLLILVGLFAGLFFGVLIWSWLADDDNTAEPVITDDRITSLRENPGVLPEPAPGPPPEATLTVHTDGCGVIRTEVPAYQHNGLTWNVYDSDGFQVLGRVADNETRYRYFQPGTYTVNLEALIGTEYVTISNTVTINC
jgi:hypothetical protein